MTDTTSIQECSLLAPDARVRLHAVSKRFASQEGEVRVLDAVDMEVRDGELVSIIGPSGSGKTTLLNVVAGLEEPDSGTLFLADLPSAERLGRVGYMQQKDLLMPWRTVLDNAALGLEIQGVPRRRAREQAQAQVAQFGLQGFEQHFPASLSGGMRQRVAFLRTVLTDDDLLLLDEPFGALDALTRTRMQEWLLDLWSRYRKTIVLVTHDVDEAIFLSDRIYVLSARPGRVKAVESVDLPRPRSFQSFTSQPFMEMKARLLGLVREESVKKGGAPWQ